jgi:alkyl sulfatase BDS1-like metallo-beta-lactamase superfamily hydrolase
MTVDHIGGGLYFVKGGSGANTAFYVGENGVTAVDAKMTADAAREILEKIAETARKPVTAMT